MPDVRRSGRNISKQGYIFVSLAFMSISAVAANESTDESPIDNIEVFPWIQPSAYTLKKPKIGRRHPVIPTAIMPESILPDPLLYGLSEAAEKANTYAQYILSLIKRFNFLRPRKIDKTGTRETYGFTEEDIQRIQQVNRLTDRGKSLREAVAMVKSNKVYQSIGKTVIDAIIEWGKNPGDSACWLRVVEAFANSPALDELERKVLLAVEGYDKSLMECAVELNLRSEKEVKDILNSAYGKVGSVIFHLLKNGV
jgi:hypothetical protein